MDNKLFKKKYLKYKKKYLNLKIKSNSDTSNSNFIKKNIDLSKFNFIQKNIDKRKDYLNKMDNLIKEIQSSKINNRYENEISLGDKIKSLVEISDWESIKLGDTIFNFSAEFFNPRKYSKGQCIDGNCNDGQGTFKYKNGDIYEGDFKDGLLHGNGKLTFKDGDIYIGEFKNSNRDGYGIWKKEGWVTEGYWKEDWLHGKVIQVAPGLKREKFVGEVALYERLEGISNFNDNIFSGIFKNNLPFKGIVLGKDGSYFEGSIKQDEVYDTRYYDTGYLERIINGDIYVGETKNGKLTGKGSFLILSEPMKTLVTGNFINGKLNGKGKRISDDGVIQEGYFKNNIMDGQGSITYSNGVILKGDINFTKKTLETKGTLIKTKGTIITPNGNKFEIDNTIDNGVTTLPNKLLTSKGKVYDVTWSKSPSINMQKLDVKFHKYYPIISVEISDNDILDLEKDLGKILIYEYDK